MEIEILPNSISNVEIQVKVYKFSFIKTAVERFDVSPSEFNSDCLTKYVSH